MTAQGRSGLVFISHASADADRAALICLQLENEGIGCWLAPRDIPAGHRYGEAILDGIDDCAVFLLLLSEAAGASPHVINEVEEGASKNKPILVVRTIPMNPPHENRNGAAPPGRTGRGDWLRIAREGGSHAMSWMCGWTAGGRRAWSALMCVAALASHTAGTLNANPGATDVINVAAVAGNGQPVNGYHVINRQASPNLTGCNDPSPAATGANVYACDPSEAAAQVCWPAPGSVLCAADPWSKSLRRFPSPGALPAVNPPAAPRPFAMLLDDGTRCILPNGIDLGGRADGTVPIYGCGQPMLSLGVLAPPDWDPAAAIDRSQPLWAVYVGQLGPPTTPFQPPIRHTVTTAWFAGSAG